MHIAFALAALVVGVIVAGYGVLVLGDPEGLAAGYWWLVPVGGLMFLGGAGYLVWLGLRALFGGG